MSDDHWQLTGGDEVAPGLVVLKDLGGGVVFEAWLAHDERLLAPVVVKIMRPSHVGDSHSRASLAREVSLMGSLGHPGIARLFAYDDGPRPYLVLEHVEGPNLSRLISKHGALASHQLYAVALELASALHYLAGEGLCHLDVKPSNVIVGAPAKLIDLSIAMTHEEAALLDHPVGSDEYMAPEQCEPGSRGLPGPASDVWGLGGTLFRAAAGFRAFDRDRPWAQLHDEPAALPPRVDPAFAAIVLDCLRPDPADRPTPREVVDRLEPLIATLPSARLAGFSLRR
ncbi:serine/threonine-protein kinase [Aeromicrobium sp. CF4.19]|uniref:serine/threonine-protein kinase n=1 Tax=Aeromicrobium sp. CF4.19 TaxID=3373082 RepID=UPI003EE51061